MIEEDYREVAAAGTTWFLDTFATPFVQWLGRNAKEQVKQKWTEYNDWPQAEEAYRSSLLRNYGSLRIFGKPDEVPLTDVFADVYILDKPTALRRFSMDQLLEHGDLRDFGETQYDNPTRGERTKGVPLAARGDNLYILGKPGAGKTTFLKYLTVQAAQNKLPRIPIFVSLNDWANSPHGKLGQETLLPYIAEQFEICHFPDAEPFIEYLLKETDRAMVLFDGLDEVKQEDEQRRTLTRLLQDFARQYDQCQCLITCRIAASDYTFQGFRDVEVADFTSEQVDQYAQKWFGDQRHKFELFQQELEKDEHKGLAELCNSPLLLSMLCLYFDDAMEFPTRRAELYEEAIDALLRKWDSSRQIQRDKIYQDAIYKDLSPRRKQQLFAAIAAQTFEKNEQFFEERQLEKLIVDYLVRLPDAPAREDIPGNEVLKAIEAQHSIFVERAKGIYSFSHLTFQEYFAARYIVENEARGTVAALAQNHLTDRRWRETFLLTASMLDDADQLVKTMRTQIDGLIADDPALVELLVWADIMAAQANVTDESKLAEIRLAYIFLALDHNLVLSLDRKSSEVFTPILNLAPALHFALHIAPALSRNTVSSIANVRNGSSAMALERVLFLAGELKREYGPLVGIDYGLIGGWQMADLLAEGKNSRVAQEYTEQFEDYFASIIKKVNDAKLTEFALALHDLTIPTQIDDQTGWRAFANRLQTRLAQVRNFDFTLKINIGQIHKLNTYFDATELLVQCLKLAVVSDRQAVMRDLLKPPDGTSSG